MKWLLVFISLFSISSAMAQKNFIVRCNGNSPHFPNSYFELFIDDNESLASAYTMGNTPLYYPSWTTAGTVTAPPSKFILWMNELNAFHPTGIDPAQVALFQDIFIDGSNRYSVEIWKLMDNQMHILGWVAHAYGEVIGCYEE